MRGKLITAMNCVAACRNIPAYAGKTHGEFPRATGRAGTSPRMRGKHPAASRSLTRVGNIPAYAGKTAAQLFWRFGLAEHPRVCGENVWCQLYLV